jgi:hypothetical protein
MEDGTRVRWDLLDSLIVNGKGDNSCVVLSGYFPYKVTIDLNLRDTLGYG